MAPGQEPLIARAESQGSNEDGIEEEDALLSGQPVNRRPSQSIGPKSKWWEVGIFVWALLATTAVIVLAVVLQHEQAEHKSDGGSEEGLIGSGKKNLIFMVSDGMGPTSLALTRTWRQFSEQLPYDDALVLDQYLIGQSRTRSTSSLVTDSAAGATAFSCGQKSYNGAISVLPNHEPCGSIMEAAKRVGYTTGLVVTTRITDATPAVFVSHVRRREMEDQIALQMIGETHPLGQMVDLMLGGGRCHFLPNTTSGSCRHDEVDVTKVAEGKGWTYIDNRQDFDNLGTSVELPLLGLFAGHDFPYEIDRRTQSDIFPSLEEMAKTALDALSAATKDSDQGFFIMIEGSRIDHAGHANDPAAQVHEVLAYDKAMAAVLDFIEGSETPTLMVSTSDHETGGLATARQLHSTYPQYLWYPGVLANVSHSASHTSHQYHAHLDSVANESREDLAAYLNELVSQNLGCQDPTESEINALVEDKGIASYMFAEMVSRRAQTGWSTHGHSGADVNIYTSDPKAAKPLIGNHENTEVGEFLRSYLGLEDEVKAVTENLKEHMKITGDFWLGSVPAASERLDGQDHLDHYTGDHGARDVCDSCGL